MTTSPTRRIGRADSKSRAQLLDAAERLMLEQGYAAVTSRRVAADAGLKPQLVHYYFRTMDDLFIEVFRRRADDGLARYRRAIDDEPSIGTLWRLNSEWQTPAFALEFAALANHRPEVRDVIADYARQFRDLQLEVLAAALRRAGVTAEQVPPSAALVIMTGIGQVISIERGLGIDDGHDETVAYVERVVRRLDPATPDATDV